MVENAYCRGNLQYSSKEFNTFVRLSTQQIRTYQYYYYTYLKWLVEGSWSIFVKCT